MRIPFLLAALLASSPGWSQGIITTVAGSSPIPIANGTSALNAAITGVHGIARDSGGNFYLSDYYRSQVFKMSTSGIITLVAGNGTFGFSGDGGPATQAALNGPNAIALDPAGNLYIADTANHRVRLVAANGTITTFAGNGASGQDVDNVAATAAPVSYPIDVLVDPSSNVYIVENQNATVRKVATNGVITTFASMENLGAPTQRPALASSIAQDSVGNIYVAAFYRVFKITPQGVVSTVAGTGIWGSIFAGPALSAHIGSAAAMAVDSSSNLYLTFHDYVFEVTKVSADGMLTVFAGTGYNLNPGSGDGGPANQADVLPWACFVDSGNNVYVGDDFGERFRKVTAGTISTVAGNGLFLFSGDGGSATNARLNQPSSVAVDNLGQVYIADTENFRVRKIALDGTINTIAGAGGSDWGSYVAPVAPLSADLGSVSGLSFDPFGNLYIASHGYARLSAAGTVDIAVASNSTGVDVVTTDPNGNLYYSGPPFACVYERLPSGALNQMAGNCTPGFSGDGEPATTAMISNLTAMAFDLAGDLYIADGNSRIRKVTAASGYISTYAGTSSGFSGDGGPAISAQLSTIGGMAFDRSGNLYFTDQGNNRLRKITPAGVISTVAGGAPGSALGDGGPPTSATLNNPGGVAIDAAGNIYIADTGNNRIRKISPRLIGTGALSVGPAIDALPGGTGRIPVNIVVPSGALVDSLTLGIQVTAGAGAPALTGALGFQMNSGIAAPSLTDASVGSPLSLAWLGIATPFSGSAYIGDVVFSIPSSAVDGNTYTVAVTGAVANAGVSTVSLTMAAPSTLTVHTTYLMGDSYPAKGDSFGSFGDDILNTLDVLATLRAVTHVPGATPASCSDRFHAMDLVQDGTLNTLDLLAILRKATNVDPTRPRASPGACGSDVAGLSRQPEREHPHPAALLELGEAVLGADGVQRVPVYLVVYQDFSWQAMGFSAGGGTGTLSLLDGEAGHPALMDTSSGATIAAAWIGNRQFPAGDRILLTTIVRSGPAGDVSIYGLSASAPGGQDIRIVTKAAR